MYCEDDLLPLSALQHLLFCERQCALIHVEGQWVENLYTAEGRILHERVHQPDCTARGKIKVEYGLALRSLRLGLAGQADVVEFHKDGKDWRPFPVEYKRGRPKKDDCDRVQLCAQAICLEEMLGMRVPVGALFYGKTRRRQEVAFDEVLRRKTAKAAMRLHEMVAQGITPPPDPAPRCRRCSLQRICMPSKISSPGSARRYLERIMAQE